MPPYTSRVLGLELGLFLHPKPLNSDQSIYELIHTPYVCVCAAGAMQDIDMMY